MRRILVTGSRDATPAMLAAARKVVQQIAEEDGMLIVGDAPGIDAEAIREADRLGIKVDVFGAYSRVRNSTAKGRNFHYDCTYPERDRHMAELCDVCVAVWDGQSRGTKLTYEYTRQLGKPVTVWCNGAITRFNMTV